MSQDDSPIPTESVYGREYLVKSEAREGTEQLFNRASILLIQVPKNSRLDFNLHKPRCAFLPATELLAAS
jgi:hypothetical protein